MSQAILTLLDKLEQTIADLDPVIEKNLPEEIETCVRSLRIFSNLIKELSPEDFVNNYFGRFDEHVERMEIDLASRSFSMVAYYLNCIKEKDFPHVKSAVSSWVASERPFEKKSILSKKIFIVHGKDHKSIKELRAILEEVGLDPIILHEQPSASMTIVEKLEKYSDVGYAFVLLTPGEPLALSSPRRLLPGDALKQIEILQPRARQNVILEFGYFIGLLGRDRVCCVHKGKVELPSDMHGIVYIPFKESVAEVRDIIIKELKEVGYKIEP